MPVVASQIVPERDANKEALKQVEKATDSEPVSGEKLLESPKLKRRLREAKERLNSGPPEPSSK